MQMPTLSDEQKRLNELFTGTWRGEEKLYPSDWDPKGGAAFGTWIVHASVDGWVTLVDYAEERDDKTVYRGHGVHTWDVTEKCFLCYWFDNIGFMPKQATRAKLEGNKYSYESEEPSGRMRMTYEFTGGKLEFKIEKSKDGSAWSPMHEGRYTRVV
jgi:hypothetical protein